MIANCDVLVTRYSSVVYVALALGKDVYADVDRETLRAPDARAERRHLRAAASPRSAGSTCS